MPHIIAALFDDRARARSALQALIESGIARDRIAILGDNVAPSAEGDDGFRQLSTRDQTVAELHELPLPEEDLQLFALGLHRGLLVLTARVDRDAMDEAVG